MYYWRKIGFLGALTLLLSGLPISAAEQVPTESHNQFLENSAAGYLFGIDISQWQFDLMKKLVDPGFSFIICKATEGTMKVDPRFHENWPAIQRRGLIRGAYHFYLDDGTPVAQADHYLSTLNHWRLFWHEDKPSRTLPPIVDIENRSVSKNADIPTLQADLLTFLKYVEEKTKRRPMIYTSVWFADTYLNNPKFGRYPLWIANYTTETLPKIPKAWEGKGAKFWQKSNRYVLNSRWTDFNIFLGDSAELYSGMFQSGKGDTGSNEDFYLEVSDQDI